MGLIGTLVTFVDGTTIQAADYNTNFTEIKTKVNTYGLFTDVARTVTAAITFAAGAMLFAATADVGSVAAPAQNAYFSGIVNVATTGQIGAAAGDVIIKNGRGIRAQMTATTTRTGAIVEVLTDFKVRLGKGDVTEMSVLIGNRNEGTLSLFGGELVMGSVKNLVFADNSGTGYKIALTTDASDRLFVGKGLGATPMLIGFGVIGSFVNANVGDAVMGNAKNFRAVVAAGTATAQLIGLDASDRVLLAKDGNDIMLGRALIALGGGAAPTFGTIGGAGPATAAQNTWAKFFDSAGAAMYVPIWK